MQELMAQVSDLSPDISIPDVFTNLLVAVVLSLTIFISYWYTHIGTAYSRKFNVSLITLTILTATVMMVIGSNIALSLGMVGALSIVRFRTAIKDSRDTTYIFWAITVGIGCGAGFYPVAIIGSMAVFIILLFLGRVTNNQRLLLIIKASRETEKEIEGTVFRQFNKKAFLRVKNTTSESIEWIYELSRTAYEKGEKSSQSTVETLYQLNGIDYVNIVTQSDEISG